MATVTWRSARRLAQPLILGHRGARHAAPENTLIAFELARVEGAAGTELDVQLSRDGHVHVVHDLDLARVTGARDRRQVRDLSRSELDAVELDGGAALPRLEEVLAWARQHDQLLNVELKSHAPRHDGIAEATGRLLNGDAWCEEHVCVSSFHPTLLVGFRAAARRIPTAFLVDRPHPRWCSPDWLERLGVDAVHPHWSLLLPPVAVKSHLDGFQVNTWTVNDPSVALSLRDVGVFSLISDNPGRLIAALSQSPR